MLVVLVLVVLVVVVVVVLPGPSVAATSVPGGQGLNRRPPFQSTGGPHRAPQFENAATTVSSGGTNTTYWRTSPLPASAVPAHHAR